MKPESKLLLLHGALGTQRQFDQLKLELSDKFQLYDLNFEGHGGVDSNNPFSIHLFAKNLEDYIISNQLNGINIFGYSMGGYVALRLALHNPSLVGQILTLGTKFNWSPIAAEKETKLLIPEKVEEKIPQFAEKLKRDHEPSDWKNIMTKTADMMKRMGAGEKINQEEFKQIKNKVTIGLGSLDNLVTREESEIVVSELPEGKLVILDNIPHPIDKADPSIVANYIYESFIK